MLLEGRLLGLETALGLCYFCCLRLPARFDVRQFGLCIRHALRLSLTASPKTGQFPFEVIDPLAQLPSPLLAHGQLRLGGLGLAMQFAALPMPLDQFAAQARLAFLQSGDQRLYLCCLGLPLLQRLTDLVLSVLRLLQAVQCPFPAVAVPGAQQGSQVSLHLGELPCLLRLSFQAAQTRADLVDDVVDTQEVGLGLVQLADRLVSLVLVGGDAGGLFEQGAAFFRPQAECPIHETLADHGVGALAEARGAQHFEDVPQPYAGVVEEVFVLARAVGAAGDGHLLELRRQPAAGIVHGEGHRGHAQARSLFGTVEDHVRRLPAAQSAEALLSQRPTDGVGDVGLAGAVRADDGSNPFVEEESGLGGEGLVALHFQVFELGHVRSIAAFGVIVNSDRVLRPATPSGPTRPPRPVARSLRPLQPGLRPACCARRRGRRARRRGSPPK